MIGQLLADAVPGTHPIVTICGGGGFLCSYDLDTVISSAIAVAVTLAVGFLLGHSLRSGKPGKLQMAFELFLSYVRNLIRYTVGDDVPAFLLPLAATIGFAWYVRHLANYNVMYGSVGASIALLVWMYIMAVISLIGCEFNAEYERAAAGPAVHPLQSQ